ARLATDDPSSNDYAAAVDAFFEAVGRDPGGLPWLVRHRPPLALTSHFEQVAGWAEQGTNLDNQNPAAFDGLGDAQFAREVHPTLYIGCRPQLAPIAYQTAVDLGSSTAQ